MSETGDKLKQGRRLLRAGDFESAVDILRQFTAENPDDAPAFEALGTACFAIGDNDGALKAFQRASQLVPQESRVFVNLGAVHNRRREFKQALDVLRKALAKNRKSADAYYNMGLAHRGLGQAKMAVNAYREAIRLAPDMAEAYQNLGNIYYEMKNFAQSVTSFRRALELRPNFERAREGLEKAETALKQQTNPGARLDRIQVATKKTSSAESAGGASIVSRDDLELLFKAAVRAHEVAGELAEKLSADFERALKELNKAVTRQTDSTGVVNEKLREFRAVINQIQPQFQEVDVRVRQIETLISGDLPSR